MRSGLFGFWSSSPPPCSRWKRQTGNAAFSLRGTNKTKQATNAEDERSKSALARRNPPPFDRRLLVTAATEERRINNLPAGVAQSCCLNLLQRRFVSLENAVVVFLSFPCGPHGDRWTGCPGDLTASDLCAPLTEGTSLPSSLRVPPGPSTRLLGQT